LQNELKILLTGETEDPIIVMQYFYNDAYFSFYTFIPV